MIIITDNLWIFFKVIMIIAILDMKITRLGLLAQQYIIRTIKNNNSHRNRNSEIDDNDNDDNINKDNNNSDSDNSNDNATINSYDNKQQ